MNQQSIIVLLAAYAFLAWRLNPRSRRERSFKKLALARSPLDDDSLLEMYFNGEQVPPDLPGWVRRELAGLMPPGIPAEQILPDDDLSPFFADLEGAELIMDIEDHFGFELVDADAEGMRPLTVRRLAELIAKKLREAGGGAAGPNENSSAATDSSA